MNPSPEDIERVISDYRFNLPGAGGLRGELRLAPAHIRDLTELILLSACTGKGEHDHAGEKMTLGQSEGHSSAPTRINIDVRDAAIASDARATLAETRLGEAVKLIRAIEAGQGLLSVNDTIATRAFLAFIGEKS